jgi:hypothetical protein
VVGAGHSMMSRTKYSYVILGTSAGFNGEIMGYSLHDFDWESYGGAHHIAAEAVCKVKAQAKVKLYMYCLVLS